MAEKKATETFTTEERAAMREHVRESRAAARAKDDAAAGEREVLAKIAEMPAADRTMAERLHAVVRATAPDLVPRTYYGMPAYARNGKVVCFFKPASKFKERYATFGFEQAAHLDEGTMWPTSYALTDLTDADRQRIGDLIRKAAT